MPHGWKLDTCPHGYNGLCAACNAPKTCLGTPLCHGRTPNEHVPACPLFNSEPCRICGRPRPVGYYSTCGRSLCQEADVFESQARTARKGSKRRQLLEKATLTAERARKS